MKVIQMEAGLLRTNCYLFTTNEGNTAIVDPGGDAQKILDAANENGGNVKYILLTHGHFDHIEAVKELKAQTGALVVIHTQDSDMLTDPRKSLAAQFGASKEKQCPADIFLNGGEEIQFDNLLIRTLHTPGHTAGSVCYLVDDAMFSGDTLFRNSIGRTDLPTGNYAQMVDSLGKLSTLKGDYHVYPGHGIATTLAAEKENNPNF